MNGLFDEEIRGHHSMRDHLLALVPDADLAYKLPGQNPIGPETALGGPASLQKPSHAPE